MNDETMWSSPLAHEKLVSLLHEMVREQNGVHLRDLLEELEHREMGHGLTPGALKALLVREHGITVRDQLKVDGVNACGIHWSAIPANEQGAPARSSAPFPRRATCVVEESDGQCEQRAACTVPVALCEYHRWQVVVSVFPELATTGHVPRRMTDVELVEAARPVAAPRFGTHAHLVYFAVNGNRVKIGFTSNLKRRLTSLALPLSCVALTVEGGRQVEAAFHRHHASLLDVGEWFRLEPPLTDYIAAKVAQPLP